MACTWDSRPAAQCLLSAHRPEDVLLHLGRQLVVLFPVNHMRLHPLHKMIDSPRRTPDIAFQFDYNADKMEASARKQLVTG
jgi:hypothetical protein